MEKKISNLSPSKTYVVRYRPVNSDIWSKNFEFTVPRPTTSQVQSATDAGNSAKIITSVKLTSDKPFTGISPFAWDAAISNDYGMWSASDNQKIYCIADGWYQASVTATFDLNAPQDAINYNLWIEKTSGAVTTLIAAQSAYDGGGIFYTTITTVTPLTYCKAGDHFLVKVDPGFGTLKGKATLTYSTSIPPVNPIPQFSVVYMGP